jgi:hypothetical protein
MLRHARFLGQFAPRAPTLTPLSNGRTVRLLSYEILPQDAKLFTMGTTPDRNTPAATNAPVPLIDMQRQYKPMEAEILAALTKVCTSGRFVLGPECQQFEEAVGQYCRAPHSIGCASGSDALLLALMAIDIGPGDEVTR